MEIILLSGETFMKNCTLFIILSLYLFMLCWGILSIKRRRSLSHIVDFTPCWSPRSHHVMYSAPRKLYHQGLPIWISVAIEKQTVLPWFNDLLMLIHLDPKEIAYLSVLPQVRPVHLLYWRGVTRIVTGIAIYESGIIAHIFLPFGYKVINYSTNAYIRVTKFKYMGTHIL